MPYTTIQRFNAFDPYVDLAPGCASTNHATCSARARFQTRAAGAFGPGSGSCVPSRTAETGRLDPESGIITGRLLGPDPTLKTEPRCLSGNGLGQTRFARNALVCWAREGTWRSSARPHPDHGTVCRPTRQEHYQMCILLAPPCSWHSQARLLTHDAARAIRSRVE